MSNPEREFDKTHLSIDVAEERGLIHRDYIAHCFRWSHVIKHLYGKHRYKTARILDIGCGKETPLAKSLYANKMSGAAYCGVDLNKIELHDMLRKAEANGKLEIHLKPQTSALDLTLENLPFQPNVITNFETFEHMNPAAARRSIEVCYEVLSDDGIMFLSTPCWNGKAAGNHINETTYAGLGYVLEDIGFSVDDSFGTFASITDYQASIVEDGLASAFNRLREYYDTNVLATIFAPLYPDQSRNALWVLSKRGGVKTFEKPVGRISQHDNWEEMYNVQS